MNAFADRKYAGYRGFPRHLGWLFLLLAFLEPCLMTQGCQPKAQESPTAMTVGPRAISLAEFQESFWEAQRADSTLRADTTSLRKYVPDFLDKVRYQLVAQEAVPVLDDGPKDRLDEARERIWVDALHQDAFGQSYKVGREELQKAYDLLGRKLRLSYIYVRDKEAADRIVKALGEGAVFSKVAEQRSEDEGSRKAGGDLGWVLYTDLDSPAREQVFALKPGEVCGPLPRSGGYQIFKVEDERVNAARQSLEKEKKNLEVGLLSRRVGEAQARFRADLLAKYHLQMDPAQVTWLTVLLHEKTSNIKRGIPEGAKANVIDLTKEPSAPENPWKEAPLAPADTGRTVATFDPPDGRVTPVMVLEQLMTDAAMAWPTFETNADVEKLVRTLVLERLELREALARGIDKRPDVLRHVAQQENEIRGRFYQRTVLRPQIHPSEDEERAFYQAHLDRYSTPEKRRFVAVNTIWFDNAIKAMNMLRAGKRPEEIKAEIAPTDTSFTATGSTGTGLMAEGKSPMLDPVIFKLPLQSVSEPIRVGESYTVAQVIDIEPAESKTFDDVKSSIQSELSTQKLAEMRTKLAREAADKYPAVIHWEVLSKAELTNPD
jgi:parvulin-like peptidyl-prolyl isomerase